MEAYRAAKVKVEQFRLAMREQMKAAFSDACKTLFEKHTKLESFGWCQYTPYFNDGDACEFGAHTDEPDVNGESYYRVEDEALVAAAEEIRAMLCEFNDEDLQEMFGDHAKITVTREGTEVTEYNHD